LGDIGTALVNMVMNIRFPQNAEKLLSGGITGGFPRKSQLNIISL
jgi:hypothetical protein